MLLLVWNIFFGLSFPAPFSVLNVVRCVSFSLLGQTHHNVLHFSPKWADTCWHRLTSKLTFSSSCMASLLPPLPWWLQCMFELSSALSPSESVSLVPSSSISSATCFCTSLCRLVRRGRCLIWTVLGTACVHWLCSCWRQQDSFAPVRHWDMCAI